MPRRKPSASPQDPIEKDFIDALQRLEIGAPTNKDLKALQVLGRLKINITAVAAEAGRSRTLIALEDCRYPRVREMIRSAMKGKAIEPRTSAELIDRLRADVADLRSALKKAEAQTLSYFVAREASERETRRWREAYERLLHKTATSDGRTLHIPTDP